jgi:hypothetical protein
MCLVAWGMGRKDVRWNIFFFSVFSIRGWMDYGWVVHVRGSEGLEVKVVSLVFMYGVNVDLFQRFN